MEKALRCGERARLTCMVEMRIVSLWEEQKSQKYHQLERLAYIAGICSDLAAPRPMPALCSFCEYLEALDCGMQV